MSDKTAIVERLRQVPTYMAQHIICKSAADRIENLERELTKERADSEREWHGREADHITALRKAEEAGFAKGCEEGKLFLKRLETLRKLMGYWQNGSDETVKLFQDDACRTFELTVGKRSISENSFGALLDKAAELVVEE